MPSCCSLLTLYRNFTPPFDHGNHSHIDLHQLDLDTLHKIDIYSLRRGLARVLQMLGLHCIPQNNWGGLSTVPMKNSFQSGSYFHPCTCSHPPCPLLEPRVLIFCLKSTATTTTLLGTTLVLPKYTATCTIPVFPLTAIQDT